MTTDERDSEDRAAVPAGRPLKPWPSYVASFLLNDMTGACKRRGLTVPACGIDPAHIGYLVRLNWEGHIDRKTARASLEFMLDRAAEVREFLSYAAAKIKPPTEE